MIMMKKSIIFFIIISLSLTGCISQAPEDSVNLSEQVKCSIDSECVPAQCCHPDSCMNQDYKTACNMLCTQECRKGTMDCNQGSCKCVNHKCEAVLKEEGAVGIANPASVYCEEQGYKLEIRNDEQGNQYGVCIFPDGSECDEWEYYRGECYR